MNNIKVGGIEFPSDIKIGGAPQISDLKFLRDITTGRHTLEGDKNDVDILLTVPHGFCLPVDYRMCDLNSLPAANLLEQDFKSTGLKVLKFVSTIPRTEKDDLNRAVGRGKSFRTSLTRWLNSHSTSDKPRWFIDVHSFPRDHSWTAGSSSGSPSPMGEYADHADLVILDDYPDFTERGPNKMYIALHDFLMSHGVTVAILQGAIDVNDINLEENQTLKDAKTLVSLLEFNEDLDHGRLSTICGLIVKFWTSQIS